VIKPFRILLGIHSPSAHMMGKCWCQTTKIGRWRQRRWLKKHPVLPRPKPEVPKVVCDYDMPDDRTPDSYKYEIRESWSGRIIDQYWTDYANEARRVLNSSVESGYLVEFFIKGNLEMSVSADWGEYQLVKWMVNDALNRVDAFDPWDREERKKSHVSVPTMLSWWDAK
jgi:hypothetical protein